jgi:hypothetical protein
MVCGNRYIYVEKYKKWATGASCISRIPLLTLEK